MHSTDTICAPATALGGAIAIIRMSGSKAHSIADVICHATHNNDDKETSHPSLHYAKIYDEHCNLIDEAMVSRFRAPHSYTGEDSTEIACHGSKYIVHRILELLINQGCRMAHPGEFTQRAFLNGKMDLSQAEAVADLIASNNQASHQIALSQLKGHFSTRLSELREQLLHITSLLELELDFSDHEDLEFVDRTELITLVNVIDNHIVQLANSFEKGQAIKDGIPVAIVGKTNVGKSTLLNRLLHEERAIVSDIHGTTRDTIEDTIDINGIQFRFIDTAGLRQTDDEIEQIGIERTYQSIEKARIVLWLLDNEPTQKEFKDIQKHCEGKPLIVIRNKVDLINTPHNTMADISISAKRDTDLSTLESAIYRAAEIPDLNSIDVIVSNSRHYESLTVAHNHLRRVITAFKSNLPADLIAEDLRLVLSTLGEITGGTITSQETLNNIFKHFCVGK